MVDENKKVNSIDKIFNILGLDGLVLSN